MRFSVSRRIFIAFACVILLLGAQGLSTAVSLHFLTTETERLNQCCADAQALGSLLNRVHTEVATVAGSRNPDLMDHYRARFRGDWERVRALAQRPGVGPVELGSLKEAYDRAIRLQYASAFELAQQELARAIPLYEAAVKVVAGRLETAEDTKTAALDRVSARVRVLTLVLGLLAIAIALFWAWYLQRFFTDRGRAESALAAALHRLESVLDSATQVAIILTDPGGVVQVFNRGAEIMTGWKAAEVVGSATPELWHDPEEVRGRQRELEEQGHRVTGILAVFSTRPRLNLAERRKWALITQSGERRSIDLAVSRVDDLNGELVGFLGIATDITQQEISAASLRRQEEQLRHSQKMDAIGQLAGGIAHDFNNMLTGIMTSAELLSGAFPEADPRSRLVRVIAGASHRAADLTGKLLSFSRKGKLISTPFSLHRSIEEVLMLLQASIDRRIEIHRALTSGEPMVVGDPSQVESALLNLCLNARDAMPDGGVLGLRTELGELDGSPCVNLFISDTGTGIPAEIQQRIFEPFFTTKPQGKGTGLGLAAAYGIVQDHRGTLEVESEPGRGTTFLIRLPLDSHTVVAGPVDPCRTYRGAGTVLVIDDEDVVRTTVSILLSAAGYDVMLAENGMEGLRLWQAHSERISLVLLDQIMPGISGAETFRRIRAMDQAARVVFFSGFATDLPTHGTRGFVHKPFSRKDLLETVERALA